MPGPAPKLPEHRRRRNVPTAGEWVMLPTEPYRGPKPRAVEIKTEFARETWKLWWSSPMAHMWVKADWPGLIRLVSMLDTDELSLDAIKEVRAQEERFGLSPKGRQGLRWRLPEVEESSTARKASSGASDMRARLQVIDGAG